MPNIAIVVEGAHDASFLGQLLKARGFKSLAHISDVPGQWGRLFPKSFPSDGITLERVMRFPELFVRGDHVVGILSSGSDSKLISTLRAILDSIGPTLLDAAGVFVDIDKHRPEDRFVSLKNSIESLNNAAVAEDQPGYPIAVPAEPGKLAPGSPAVGIFMFPDNVQPGALETILLDCASRNHPAFASAAIQLVHDLDKAQPADEPSMKALRSGMAMNKAAAGIVANLLKPGASLAVSLSQTGWLKDKALASDLVSKSDAFLSALLGEEPKK